jgi:hypothetical protein
VTNLDQQRIYAIPITHFLKTMLSEQCTVSTVNQLVALRGRRVGSYQSFQVFAVFAQETSIGSPYPIPSRIMPSSSSKENDGVVGLD